jgi:perosamine synthetase
MTKRTIQISLPSTGDDEWQATRDCFQTGWLTQGPKVSALEKVFSERHKVKHSLAVTSCTTGLHLILAAMDIGPGDEVIVPAFTWVATANVVLYCGAKPVFVDVSVNDFNIDPLKIKAKITPRTKAIIAVHLFGYPADIDAIREIAPGIPIIEDAACAAGSEYKGTPVGGLGIAGAFSFHPRKSVTTGEGGMVTTNNSELSQKMNQLRNHGASISEEERHNGPKPYLLPAFNLLGYNYRMTDLQGAVGLVQFKKLDNFIEEREQWAKFYISELEELKWLKTPKIPTRTQAKHGWQSFVCLVDPKTAPRPRNEIMAELFEKGISTRPGTHAITTLGYYTEQQEVKSSDYPIASFVQDQTIAIPLHNRMSADDYRYVVDVLKSIK